MKKAFTKLVRKKSFYVFLLSLLGIIMGISLKCIYRYEFEKINTEIIENLGLCKYTNKEGIKVTREAFSFYNMDSYKERFINEILNDKFADNFVEFHRNWSNVMLEFSIPIFLITLFKLVMYYYAMNSNSKRKCTHQIDFDNVTHDLSEKPNKVEHQIIYNEDLTGFKAELQENTKTLQQVFDEEWEKEKQEIIEQVNSMYSYIKQSLIDKAKLGQYTIKSNKRVIQIDAEESFLLKCVDRRIERNPSGRLGTRGYQANEKVIYQINKRKAYDYYLKTIKNLAAKDDINIDIVVFSKQDKTAPYGELISLPYTHTGKILVTSHRIAICLRCIIEY